MRRRTLHHPQLQNCQGWHNIIQECKDAEVQETTWHHTAASYISQVCMCSVFSVSTGVMSQVHTDKENIYRQVTKRTNRNRSVGAFCWHGLGPPVPLEGRVTADQHKFVLSVHCYPVMKHFYSDGSGLFQDDNALIQRAREVTEVFDK